MWNFGWYEKETACFHFYNNTGTGFFYARSERMALDQMCRHYGSSLKERKMLTRALCGSIHQGPILISLSPVCFVFPVVTDRKTLWIFQRRIQRVEESFGQTCLVFRDGQRVENVSKQSVLKRINHCLIMEQVLQLQASQSSQ